VPLGQSRFSKETGIKETDWLKFWPRLGDAIREAGYEPNRLTTAYDETFLIEKFIGLARELGHFPVSRETKMKARSDDTFPSYDAFARLGLKQKLAAKILEYCRNRTGYEDIIALCEPIAARVSQEAQEPDDADASTTKQGYVYMALLKLGREKRYKIGKAVLVLFCQS